MKLPGEPHGKEDALKTDLRALKREIRAVKLAIETIDEGATKERQEADGKPPAVPSSSESQPQAKPQAGVDSKQGNRDDKSLQRAGLAQRLSDLMARKEELKVRQNSYLRTRVTCFNSKNHIQHLKLEKLLSLACHYQAQAMEGLVVTIMMIDFMLMVAFHVLRLPYGCKRLPFEV